MVTEITTKIKLKLSTIWNISNKINSTMDISTLLVVIMEAAKAILKCEGSALMLMDEESNELKFDVLTGEVTEGEAAQTVKSIRVPLGVGVAGIVAESGEPLIVNDAANDPRVFKKVDEASNFTTKNLLCVPMKIHDKLIGVLEVVNSIDRDSFTNHDLIILNYLSDQAAIAIHNRELFLDLREANEELYQKFQELTALYEISQATTQSYDLTELFATSIKVISELLNASRCSLFIYEKDINKLVHYASIGIPELEETKYKIDADKGIMSEILKESYPILVTDIDTEARFSKYKKEAYITKSFLSVPLVVNEEIVGLINLADKKGGEVFNSTDLILASSIGSNLASALNTFKLNQELLEKVRLKKELETAVAIQKRILPKSFEGIGQLKIDAFTIPASNVGGDYYDFVSLDENRFALVMADVSGKGIPAALFAALSRNTLRAEINNFTTTEKIFEKANNYICMDSEAGMFVTAVIFLINHRDKTIHFASAGHNAQVFYHSDDKRLELLKSNGIPLGVIKNSKFQEKFMHYKEGDTLILFTDGAVEANNEKEEMFGEEEFYELIKKYSHLDYKEMLHEIKREILEFSSEDHLFDDFTMMLIRF